MLPDLFSDCDFFCRFLRFSLSTRSFCAHQLRCLSLNAGDVTFSFVSHERGLKIMAMAKLCFLEHFTLVTAVMEGQVFCEQQMKHK